MSLRGHPIKLEHLIFIGILKRIYIYIYICACMYVDKEREREREREREEIGICNSYLKLSQLSSEYHT